MHPNDFLSDFIRAIQKGTDRNLLESRRSLHLFTVLFFKFSHRQCMAGQMKQNKQAGHPTHAFSQTKKKETALTASPSWICLR
mmetsp:Transcript_40247/g.79374  ORF Transcript_40247/g.79374 Transcript_40247/m.79374 type:complete len:83 (-) Transcript_40247:1286-1534(-)